MFHWLTISLAFVAMGLTSAAFGQDGAIAQRQVLAVDWPAARAKAEADLASDPEGITAFRAAVPTGVESVTLPVLVPGSGPVRASPRFRSQETAYAALYPLPAAKLTVLGSAIAIVLSPDDSLASEVERLPVSEEGDFDVSEDGSDLAFTMFGASYVLRISCANADDSRCADRVFLDKVKQSLLVLGGSQ
ncbi:MAG: hypothetical protein KDK07_04130 [Bauldia sp.]|nr:hypothetical protein [Bauldia sp.]